MPKPKRVYRVILEEHLNYTLHVEAYDEGHAEAKAREIFEEAATLQEVRTNFFWRGHGGIFVGSQIGDVNCFEVIEVDDETGEPKAA